MDTKIRRMTYANVYDVIAKYAAEVLPNFADSWSRFPSGENAAMIVNYLNDHAETYRKIAPEICKDMIDAATEIIVRCK